MRAQVASDLFSSTNLLRISITIPEAGMNALRSYRWNQENPSTLKRPYALATVRSGEAVFTNVAVHLKGSFGSFRSVDGTPALTLNFDKFAPGQEFYGLHKVSLNNSVQDPTCLNEKLCRELFESAGVPVPRADHAVVILNGRKLGLYVLTEGFGKRFLKRHFKKANGNLYDAGYLHDIDHPEELRLDIGNNPEAMPSLKQLFVATRQLDPTQRFKDIAQVLDVDRFLSMMAMEVILCHWDSYSMNRNNYWIYYDPDSRKLVFIPHGMDQVLGIDRPNFDLPLVPRMLGKVSRALVSTPQGRRQYLARIDHLFVQLFEPAALCRHLHQIDAKIADELQSPQRRWPVRGRDPRAFVMSSGSHEQDVEQLCQRIFARADSLRRQLSQLSSDDVRSPGN
jgi:spore coat protein CotH